MKPTRLLLPLLALPLLAGVEAQAQTTRIGTFFTDRTAARGAEFATIHSMPHQEPTLPVETAPTRPATGYFDPLDAFRLALLREVKYPHAALHLGLEGTVVVRVQLLTDGRVRLARLVRSAGRLLDEAVLQAVETCAQTSRASVPDSAVCRTMDYPVVFRQ